MGLEYDDVEVVYNDVLEILSRTYFIMDDGSELGSKEVINDVEKYLSDGRNSEELGTKLYAMGLHTRDPLSFMIGYITYAKLVMALNQDLNKPAICVETQDVTHDETAKYMALALKKRSMAQIELADQVLKKLEE